MHAALSAERKPSRMRQDAASILLYLIQKKKQKKRDNLHYSYRKYCALTHDQQHPHTILHAINATQSLKSKPRTKSVKYIAHPASLPSGLNKTLPL